MDKLSTRDTILRLWREAARAGRHLTYRDIAREAGIHSTSTVNYHMTRLREDGLLREPEEKEPRRLRVRLKDGGELVLLLDDDGILAVDATKLRGLKVRAEDWQFS